jgi:hypothetical protein
MKKLGQASQKPTVEKTQPTNESKATDKMSYADLIKSDDYKAEHEEYMKKTIGDRLKKFNGMEEQLDKYKNIAETVANKYGINADDEDFLEVLNARVEEDDAYYEDYAIEHDITVEQARKSLNMDRKVARMEAEKQRQEQERQRQEHILTLHQNAEKTKARFPDFDLDMAMQNEQFRNICAVTRGDTTAAYMATNWNRVIPAQVQMASEQIKRQTAQVVSSNRSRPIENGMSSTSPSVVQGQDFSKMNLKELRAWAEEQRRLKSGR